MKNGAKLGPLKHKLNEFFGVGSPNPAPKLYPKLKWQGNWTERDTLQYLRQTRVLLSSIIRSLDELSIHPTEARSENSEFLGYRSQKSLPAIPGVWSKQSLTHFIHEITKWRYVGAQRLTDPAGLISIVVRDVLRPTNERTVDSLNTSAFNLAIEYFVRIRDLEQARQMVSNMNAVFIKPTPDTMHHFLRSQAMAPATLIGGNPCLRTISVLNEMKRHSLPANSLTWNLVLQGSPMGFGKSLVLEEMTKRQIPLDGRSLAMCLDIVCTSHGLERALEYALDQGKKLPPEAVILLVTKLLQNRQEPILQRAQMAFKFLSHAVNVQDMKPDVSLLNAMLKSTWGFRRLDWHIGLVGYFKRQHGISPDPETWEHMLHTLAVMKKAPNIPIAAGMILCLASRQVLTPKSRIWGRQIIRRLGSQLRDPGVAFFDSLCTKLDWDATKGPNPVRQIDWGTQDQWPLADIDPTLFGPIPRTDSPSMVNTVVNALKESPQEAYDSMMAKWPSNVRT